ncbi:hypothetical protein [Streptomyces sp. CB01881]|uniref:hypothetical protein n=1 Tax=Streptomyces sp. CB01881 TaxID=2078691 RepID=UPI00129CB1DE|nr:hypothetical protein [Streptomyces sp. CB01881]
MAPDKHPHPVVLAPDLRITTVWVGDSVVRAFTGDLHLDNEHHVRRALERPSAGDRP